MHISINWLAGEPFEVPVAPSETLLDLKKKIEVKQGIKPERQSLYFMGYLITEDDADVEELMKIGGDSATLVLPKASSGPLAMDIRNNFIDEEKFLINGKKRNFEPVRILPNRNMTVELKSKRFGISYHVEGVEMGKRKYQVEIYKVKEAGSIKLSNGENGMIKVVLTRFTGKAEAVEVLKGKMMVYDEAKNLQESHIDKAVKGFLIVGELAHFKAFVANLEKIVNLDFLE